MSAFGTNYKKIDNNNQIINASTNLNGAAVTFQEYDINGQPVVSNTFSGQAKIVALRKYTDSNGVERYSKWFGNSNDSFVEYIRNGTDTLLREGRLYNLHFALEGTLTTGNYIEININ